MVGKETVDSCIAKYETFLRNGGASRREMVSDAMYHRAYINDTYKKYGRPQTVINDRDVFDLMFIWVYECFCYTYGLTGNDLSYGQESELYNLGGDIVTGKFKMWE